jgi:hypothetical protein
LKETRQHQVCADNGDLFGGKTKRKHRNLLGASKQIDLEADTKKTKFTFKTRCQTARTKM